MQNLPVKKEISERRAGVGKFRMHIKFVWNARECVQLGLNFGVAKYLQQMLAVLRRDSYVRQAVEKHCRRVACLDMSDGAGVIDRGLVTPRGQQRLCDVLYVGCRVEGDTGGKFCVRLAGGK